MRTDLLVRPPDLGAVLEQRDGHGVGGVDPRVQDEIVALALGRDLGDGDGVDPLELGLEGLLDLVAEDAHLEGQCPGRVVVGGDRGAAGVLPHVGIFLLFEQGPGEGLVGLGRLDHERPGVVEPAAGDEVGLGLMDLDPADLQDLEHLERRRIVPLDGRDDEGVRLALVDLLDRVLGHLVEVEEQVLLVEAGRLDHALRQRRARSRRGRAGATSRRARGRRSPCAFRDSPSGSRSARCRWGWPPAPRPPR